jgi:hypothetical protein
MSSKKIDKGKKRRKEDGMGKRTYRRLVSAFHICSLFSLPNFNDIL